MHSASKSVNDWYLKSFLPVNYSKNIFVISIREFMIMFSPVHSCDAKFWIIDKDLNLPSPMCLFFCSSLNKIFANFTHFQTLESFIFSYFGSFKILLNLKFNLYFKFSQIYSSRYEEEVLFSQLFNCCHRPCHSTGSGDRCIQLSNCCFCKTIWLPCYFFFKDPVMI